MKNHQKICVFVAVAVLGNVSAAYAQTTGGFNRVTTITQNGGSSAQSSRTAQSRGSSRLASPVSCPGLGRGPR